MSVHAYACYSQKVAKYVGHDTMVELSMGLKMAENVDNVLNFIDR